MEVAGCLVSFSVNISLKISKDLMIMMIMMVMLLMNEENNGDDDDHNDDYEENNDDDNYPEAGRMAANCQDSRARAAH